MMEILSWMIDIWMKIHLVSESFAQHCKSIMLKVLLQGMQIMLGLHQC
jgi:hypothetical protein